MRNLSPSLKLFLFIIICATLITSACKKTDPAIPEIPDQVPGGKPNIILVIGDDIGYEVPGFTGGESYSTPNMDAMVDQGIRFSRCYGSPMCAPTRFMLLTGKYNFRNYGPNSWGDLGLDQKTVANMLQSVGYSTCAVGKWQFNHGDTGLATFGFDKYCVTNPFKVGTGDEDDASLRLYKNPTIYQNGAYLPEADMLGKYSEDVFLDYMFNFMDSSTKAKKPYFLYYAPNLCHSPLSPTPDDPEFAGWDPDHAKADADTVFFKSMIKYYDKNIGKLLAKLRADGTEQNTLILFILGDNGTEDQISSKFHGKYVKGGKGHTYITGIHLAFAAYWAGHIAPAKNGSLIDLVDFLPTIADAAGIAPPTSYGTLDGISFYDQLMGGNKKEARQYSYNWYDVNRFGPDSDPPAVWSMDKEYKLYSNETGLIDYETDFLEKSPIPDADQSADQKAVRATLQSVIDSYHN